MTRLSTYNACSHVAQAADGNAGGSGGGLGRVSMNGQRVHQTVFTHSHTLLTLATASVKPVRDTVTLGSVGYLQHRHHSTHAHTLPKQRPCTSCKSDETHPVTLGDNNGGELGHTSGTRTSGW